MGTVSLFFNIKSSRTAAERMPHPPATGGVVQGGKGAASSGGANGVEMKAVDQKIRPRASRSEKKRRKAGGSGGYAPVGDVDGSVHGSLMTAGGFYDSDEEEVDLKAVSIYSF